jgi:pimeloyl-ACP methyl ester carboxylesterase
MSSEKDTSTVRHVETPSGRIAYVEVGLGPVALFVHGVVLNKHMWRRQLTALSDIRRCIAVDLLAHGDTEIAAVQEAFPKSKHHACVRNGSIYLPIDH